MAPPTVSIKLMVYNNQVYIKDAMDSIMKQKTTFPVELVVGDDFSTDNTLNIIKGYKDTENIKIKILDRNKGGNYWKKRKAVQSHITNFIDIIHHCEGSYIAFLDGDDYWTDPLKLQKQVDFLENNRDFSCCFHNVLVLNDRYKEKPSTYPLISENVKGKNFTEDIIRPWFISKASIMFRSSMFNIPEWFSNISSGDIATVLLLSTKGPIGYLDEIMAVYRIHQSGISATHISYKKVMDMAYLYKAFDIHSSYKFTNELKEAFASECYTHLLKHKLEDYRNKLIPQLQLEFKNEVVNNITGLDELISFRNLLWLGWHKIRRKFR